MSPPPLRTLERDRPKEQREFAALVRLERTRQMQTRQNQEWISSWLDEDEDEDEVSVRPTARRRAAEFGLWPFGTEPPRVWDPSTGDDVCLRRPIVWCTKSCTPVFYTHLTLPPIPTALLPPRPGS